MTAPSPSIHPERLLARTDTTRSASLLRVRLAARAARVLLGRARRERLIVREQVPGQRTDVQVYGADGPVTIEARVVVHDERALAAIATEGSIGLGRGYIEGWWSSDDPTAVVRFAIRNVDRIDSFRNRLRHLTGWASDPIRRALPRDTRRRNREDIGAHYDIGNDFFALFLDDTMSYSSAVFESPDSSLTAASLHKYDRLLDKLGVRADDHLLEIGTGWGGLALRAAGGRGARVTTTTISNEQLAEARRRIEEAGLNHRVTLLDEDWRDLTGTYDHVVSVEMIEAVDWRDYRKFFARIDARLAPGGRAALQAICLPDDRWPRAKNTEDFIRRFVFPNGYLPSVSAVDKAVGAATSLSIVDVEDLTPHYAETLRRWRSSFDANADAAAALGLDERFRRLWRFYLCYCEAGFAERHVRLVQILLSR